MIKPLLFILFCIEVLSCHGSSLLEKKLWEDLEVAKELRRDHPHIAELTFENLLERYYTTGIEDEYFLSEVYFFRGRNLFQIDSFALAIPHFELSLLNRASFPDDHRTANSIFHLSMCHWNLNSRSVAKTYIDSAILVYQDKFEPTNKLLKGRIFNFKGLMLLFYGETKEADDAFINALRHLEKYINGENEAFEVWYYTLYNYGYSKKNQKDFYSAIKQFEKLSVTNVPKTFYYYNWIISLAEIGQYDKALELNQVYEKLAHSKKDSDRKKQLLYRTYNSYSYIYRGLGEYQLAIENLNASKKYLYNSEKELIYYDNLALIYRDSERLTLALQNMHNAIQVGYGISIDSNYLSVPRPSDEKIFQTRYQNIIEVNQSKAELLLNLYNESKDIKYLKSSFEHFKALDDLFNLTYKNDLSNTSLLEFLKVARLAFEQALLVCDLLVEKDTSNKEHYFFYALYFMERSKALLLQDQLKDLLAAEVLDEKSSLDLGRLKLEFSDLRRAYSNNPSEQIFDEIHQKKIQLDKLNKALEQENEAFYQLKNKVEVPDLLDIQEKILQENQTIISYFEGNKFLFIFWINNETYGLEKIEKEQNYTKLVHDFNGMVQDSSEQAPFKTFSNVASQLSNLLLAKVPIQEKERLVILPDGILSMLPFDALLTQKESNNNYNDAKYLGKEHPISYDYSLSTLLYPGKKEKKGRPLIFGSNYRGYRAKTLYHAEFETKAIQKIIKGKLIHHLDDSLESFKTELERALVAHFALHAIAINEDPMQSYIVIPLDIDGKKDTARLTMLDIHKMKLDNLMFAYLSACETGDGELLKGEGIMSIARAFKHQGCSSLVMSKWLVNDYVGKEIAIEFYKRVKKGKAIDVALFESKKQYMKNLNNVNKMHPYYWSGINCIGNTSFLYKQKSRIHNMLNMLLVVFISLILSYVILKRLQLDN